MEKDNTNRPCHEDTLKTKARAASIKYGKEITPEQYVAVEYFAEEAALAYRDFACRIDTNPELANKNAEMMKNNHRDSMYKMGNLDNLVKSYQEERSNEYIQSRKREERVNARMENYERLKKECKSRLEK